MPKRKHAAWAVIILMLVAIAMYVLTLDDSTPGAPKEILDPAQPAE